MAWGSSRRKVTTVSIARRGVLRYRMSARLHAGDGSILDRAETRSDMEGRGSAVSGRIENTAGISRRVRRQTGDSAIRFDRNAPDRLERPTLT
ncbi:hypothetical protein ACVBGC_01830 [Burkholderia stagnalis]